MKIMLLRKNNLVPKGSGRVPKTNIWVPKGSRRVPKGSRWVPKGSRWVPKPSVKDFKKKPPATKKGVSIESKLNTTA
jgi:hypothetical protein